MWGQKKAQPSEGYYAEIAGVNDPESVIKFIFYFWIIFGSRNYAFVLLIQPLKNCKTYNSSVCIKQPM